MNNQNAQEDTAKNGRKEEKKCNHYPAREEGKNGPKCVPSMAGTALDRKESKTLAKKNPPITGKADAKENVAIQTVQKMSDTKVNKDKPLGTTAKPVDNKRKVEQVGERRDAKNSKRLQVEMIDCKQSKDAYDQKKMKGSKEGIKDAINQKKLKGSMEGMKDANDQKKARGSKEGMKDENDQRKMKGSKELIKDVNDQKKLKGSNEGMKDELEKKEGKPREGKVNDDAKRGSER